MRILLASPRGFCAGVNMAIESLELAIQAFGTPLYVYHEIVHNRWVVEHFRAAGVVFVNDLAEVPGGAHLLYSAHGVPPEVRRRASDRGLKTIDATCPLVTKVHAEAVRFAREGYTIILIGHPGHDEVVGTMGEAPQSMILIKDIIDVDQLALPEGVKLAYLTQTTLSAEDAAIIVGRLRGMVPADRRAGAGRHLLRHPKPARGRQTSRRRGGLAARGRQPEQLEQPAVGGTCPITWGRCPFDRRPADIDLAVVSPGDDGGGYRRRECAGIDRRAMCRVLVREVLGGNCGAVHSRGASSFHAARPVAGRGAWAVAARGRFRRGLMKKTARSLYGTVKPV